MRSFKTIRARAAKRKGGEGTLAALLPKVAKPGALAKLSDDRALAEMAKRVFSAGFVWSVIETSGRASRRRFSASSRGASCSSPTTSGSELASDKRIVRNPQKIMAVRDNARFVCDMAGEHGSFGKFLVGWPAGDQIGLLEVLAKRGARLGARTGQYFLRFIGKDCFVTSGDVVTCLRDAGLDIAENRRPARTSRKSRGSSTSGPRRPDFL